MFGSLDVNSVLG